MCDVFGKPALVIDTHCIRLVKRLGLVDQRSEAGRDVCTARTKSFCSRCCLTDICTKEGLEEDERQ